jgi:AcrR family transcriptional regulator
MTPADRPARDAATTRESILDVAERLFARDGLAGVPTRAVLREAGQRNESALHYHFGGRDGLLVALHARRLDQLEALRRPRLAEVTAGDGPIAIADLARVQLDSLAELARTEPGFVDYLKLLGELVFTPRADLDAALERFEVTGSEAVRRRVAASVPHLAPATLTRRLDLGRRFILMSLSRWARLNGDFSGPDADRLVTDLADMITAMLSAPESAPPEH